VALKKTDNVRKILEFNLVMQRIFILLNNINK
jgi:hypothetical protein